MKKYTKEIIAGIVILVLALLLLKSCNDKSNSDLIHKNEKIVWEQNKKALNDSVRIVKNKAGELEYEINNFISTKEDLESLSKNLSKELNKEKGKVSNLTQALFESKMEPIKMDNSVIKYNDNQYGLKFKHESGDDNYKRIITGVSKFSIVGLNITPGQTEIDTNNFEFKLIMGHRKDDNGYVFFARTKAPGVKLLDAESVLIIDKPGDLPGAPLVKPKKFGIGFQVGGTLTKEFMPTPYIGIGLSYNIIRF